MDLSMTPAAAPPPGVAPNFIDPASLAPLCVVVISITLPLMIIFLVFRLYVRLMVSRTFGVDDLLCFVSALLVVVFCGLTLSVLNNPVGPHQWNVPVSKVTPKFEQIIVTSIVVYALGCLTVKTTLLTLYLRVFGPNPTARTMIHSGLVFIVVFYTISVIVTLSLCVPRQGEEGWALAELRCSDGDERFAEAQGIVGALTDLYVFCIPMMFLASLRLSRKRKLGLYGIFLTGFLACIISIVNATYRFINFTSDDQLWNEVLIYALCAAELNFGIICACMPVVFVLFKGMAERTRRWAARLKYWTPHSKLSTEKFGEELPEAHPQLPAVPQGTLSGLKSYLRRVTQSRPSPANDEVTRQSAEEFLSLRSEDYDYHGLLFHTTSKGDAGSFSKTCNAV